MQYPPPPGVPQGGIACTISGANPTLSGIGRNASFAVGLAACGESLVLKEPDLTAGWKSR